MSFEWIKICFPWADCNHLGFLCDVFLLIHTIYLFRLCITVIFCSYSRLAGSFREELLLEQCLQH